MVKFSATGKKRSSDTVITPQCYSDDDVEEDDEQVCLQSKRLKVETGESSSSSSSIGKQNDLSGDELITVRLDPDVLDCSICFEPLVPPVFQVTNGKGFRIINSQKATAYKLFS